MEVGIKMKLMKKVTIEMACSINGLIATEDGNEDFLSYRGWEIKEKEDIVQAHYSIVK
jgi:hypothetical protein